MKKLWYDANGDGWRLSKYRLEDDPYSIESAWSIKDCWDREVLVGKGSVIFGHTQMDQGEGDIAVLDRDRVRVSQEQRRASLKGVV